MNEILELQGLLFREKVRLSKIEEFGYSWEKLMAGNTKIPEHGLKFNIHFEGEISGEINGTVRGVDYLTVRADGKFLLNLHAIIETNDGALIKLTETGVNSEGDLRLNMDFHTEDPHYIWLNKKHVWGEGKVDFHTGEVTINGYIH